MKEPFKLSPHDTKGKVYACLLYFYICNALMLHCINISRNVIENLGL